jgi:hypothetical protein
VNEQKDNETDQTSRREKRKKLQEGTYCGVEIFVSKITALVWCFIFGIQGKLSGRRFLPSSLCDPESDLICDQAWEVV